MVDRRRLRAAVGARVRERRIRPADVSAVRVLTYHGLVDTKRDAYLERNFHTIDQFRTHLAILRRHRVVHPEQVVDLARHESRLTVAITFDDGYENNQIAAELLDEARLPWTVFVSTGEVGGRSTIWTARLGLLLLQGEAARVTALGRDWGLADRDERVACFQELRRLAKKLPQVERIALVDAIVDQFPSGEVDRLLDAFPSFRMLDWTQLRSIASQGVTIGSHGTVHEIQHADQPTTVIERELVDSQAMIAEQLGTACTSLSYPNGDWTERSCQLAQRLGFETAFTTHGEAVRPEANRYALPRLTAIGDEMGFTRALLAGHTGRP